MRRVTVRRSDNRPGMMGSQGAPTNKNFAAPGVRDGTRLKSFLSQQPQPGIPGKHAKHMVIVNDAQWCTALAQQISEIHCVGRVGRLFIERPFDISYAAAFPVVAAVSGERDEG